MLHNKGEVDPLRLQLNFFNNLNEKFYKYLIMNSTNKDRKNPNHGRSPNRALWGKRFVDDRSPYTA